MTSKGIVSRVAGIVAHAKGGKMEKRIHRKVNLPNSAEAYERGNGEGVFVLVDAETKRDYDANAEGGEYEGILDNDSWYWRGLDHGEVVPFEMRGEFRPVVPYEWLNERFTINPEWR